MFHSVGRFAGQRAAMESILSDFARDWTALDQNRWAAAEEGRRRTLSLWAEIIGAQVVSVPMSASALRAEHIRRLFVIPFAAFLVLLFVSVNLLLNFVVIRPIECMAKTAEAISMGEINTPDYVYRGSGQLARLSTSFNRMHRSLVEAFRMLGDG